MTEQEIALANAKGLETRRRRWEQRNEKNVWLPLRQREAARAARRADEAFMEEAVRQAKSGCDWRRPNRLRDCKRGPYHFQRLQPSECR
ncbi:MAG: hypothetical protein ACLUEJ_09465 [Clostridium sp.]